MVILNDSLTHSSSEIEISRFSPWYGQGENRRQKISQFAICQGQIANCDILIFDDDGKLIPVLTKILDNLIHSDRSRSLEKNAIAPPYLV